MKNLVRLTVIISFLALTSCGSTKEASVKDNSTNTVSNTSRDGSSFEKAIVVNSVPEEYEYVRRVCKGCQMMGQSLVFDKKKPYDILRAKKPSGEEVEYYFDISKFF